MRSLGLALIGLTLAGCAGFGAPARFDGRRAPAMTSAEAVREVEAVPRGYRELGEVSASCALTELRGGRRGVRLSDLDCSEARLMEALREAAAAAGGELLAARSCTVQRHGAERLAARCSARVARPTDETLARRPLAPRGSAPDRQPEPSASEAWRVFVAFTPSGEGAAGPKRRADLVRELAELPASHVVLGAIVARCPRGCTEASVRGGLRIAAGRVGATELVGARCVPRADGFTCTGTAATFRALPVELDPASW